MGKVSRIREATSTIEILGLLFIDVKDLAKQKICAKMSEENFKILTKMKEIILYFRVSKNKEEVCLTVDRELLKPALNELLKIMNNSNEEFKSLKIRKLKCDINFEGPIKFKVIEGLAVDIIKFNSK